jgi:RNA polymerase sigma-70 factor (ECF subfamily)
VPEKMSEHRRNEKFLELIGPHYQGYFAYARYLTGSLESAEDLLQSASLNGLKYLHQLKDEAKFKSWFYRIIHNTFRNQNRRQEYRKTSHVDDETLQGYINQNGGTGDISEKILSDLQLEEAISKLTPQLRETLLLFEREGFSIAEISKTLGRSESAIKHRLRTARDQLRIHYFSGMGPVGCPDRSESALVPDEL